MNNELFAYILNMKAMAKSFECACHMAAAKDGEVDTKEAKALNKIQRATVRYVKALDKAQETISPARSTTPAERTREATDQRTSSIHT